MSVNSYLVSLASKLVLKGEEEESIATSVSTISTRIKSYFGSNVDNHFKFGSSTRGTILPRKADENSDIDYMVVFNTSEITYKPQTYLTQLKNFANKYYHSSEIYQSHPTLVLELKHIKFELVPAIYSYGYQIPSPAKDWNDWMPTDPTGFNERLTNANKNNNFQIKPLVRLIKYWNSVNGHYYSSYGMENYIVGLSLLSCSSLRDCFYSFWDGFYCNWNDPQYIKDKVQSAKDRIKKIKEYERQGQIISAENELKKLLPDI
jgi:tRNA nucleotidyltransferase (CCA-adding enzyme)